VGGILSDNNSSYGYNSSGFEAPQGKELGLGGILLPTGAMHPGPEDVQLIKESAVALPSDMISLGDARLLSMIDFEPAISPMLGGVEAFLDLSPPDWAIRLELGLRMLRMTSGSSAWSVRASGLPLIMGGRYSSIVYDA
jgi:hypothetical protein